LIVVVMGVSGAGKTTIGAALARELGWRFIDADDHHPPQNVAKMAAGTPLTDEDRAPWLHELNALLRKEERVVLACSALKERYRKRLTQGLGEVQIVYLQGEPELIRSRLAGRQHRYMPAALLESQFQALEPPADAITVDVSSDVAACVAAIVAQLKR
jgi:gluconokinase